MAEPRAFAEGTAECLGCGHEYRFVLPPEVLFWRPPLCLECDPSLCWVKNTKRDKRGISLVRLCDGEGQHGSYPS